MTKTPLVSVVVPSYNSGHFLRWTLESIAAQTLSDFECILVDDCSTDGALSTVSDILKDRRFRLIKQKMNVGLSGARNAGLRAARAKFVAFLDSDDLMMTNSLEMRLATCRWGERNSDRFAGSYCASMSIEEDCKKAPASTPVPQLGFADFISAAGQCPFNANQPMIRRDILRASGGFSHALKQAEDYDLWQRILRAGYTFAPARYCSVTYRKRAGSMVRRQPLVHLNTALAIANSVERPMTDDQLSWSKYRMPNPLGSYAAQRGKQDRVLEFVGMALAGAEPTPVEDLAEVIATELPDLADIQNPCQGPEVRLRQGVKRQTGGVDDAAEDRIQTLLTQIATAGVCDAEAEKAEEPAAVYGQVERDRLWFSEMQAGYDVVFVPHSAYHVWTISLLAKELSALGLRYITVDISPEWRNGGVRNAAEQYQIELVGMSEFVLGRFAPRGIVTFNDWDPVTRPILIAAKDAGVRTIAIVEGIQDYDDADLHWRRFAYKTSDVVLLPGAFDQKYFTNHHATVTIGGVPRIEKLRRQAPRNWDRERTPRVLINSNFSYGVLEQHRDAWLTASVEAVLDLGMTPVISRHPADTGKLFSEYVSDKDFYETLESCDITIQRFASGMLEALARQVGLIYFNPHGEKVDKFQADPMGAYTIVDTPEGLRAALSEWWELHEKAAEFGGAFLDHHSGSLEEGAIARCARALGSHLSERPDARTCAAFRRNLEVIDLETTAFSQVRFNGEALFTDPSTAGDKLNALREAREAILAEVAPDDIELPEAPRLPVAVKPLEGADLAAQSSLELAALAAEMLLSPASARGLLQSKAPGVAQALAALPQDDHVRQHFERVRDFAEAV